MSLQVDDGGRRARSRSPGRRADVVEASPYSSTDRGFTPSTVTAYSEYERLSQWGSAADEDFYGARPPSVVNLQGQGHIYGDPLEAEYGRYSGRRADRDRDSDSDSQRRRYPEIRTAEPSSSPRDSRDSFGRESDKERRRREKKDKLQDDLAYGKLPGQSKYDAPVPQSIPIPIPNPSASAPSFNYAQPRPYEYGSVSKTDRYGASLEPAPRPGRSPSPGPSSPLKSAMKRTSSPLPPTNRMSTLSVHSPHHSLSLSSAPPSPLLEAYHGTYQSMSPMPSPLLMPSSPGHHILEALSPLGSDSESEQKKKRRARFHDPVDDAARLAKALKGDRRPPETEPLIEILPGMSHEQIMELRQEYKRLVKTGTERKGVNIAKHIRARLKDEDPNLMKACYATALGRWESESYWANFWYHGDKTRRELLIESLMGRSNEEIRLIKDGFSDKKYGNSLTRAMRTELREDKFKKAVLMVLEGGRQEDVWDGRERRWRVDADLVEQDVRELYKAVKSEKGGESKMLEIVVGRGEEHLREVMRVYREVSRGGNFAKDALKKSGNLVGEVLAHILNGVINKPMRDAMLLQHALKASKKDELRKELLISRLVRYHWDANHMQQVKRAFREQYGQDLSDAVKEGTKDEWGAFCRALCITRMPDAEKVIARVDIHRK
ncbi:hypothetical protein QC763_117530 [Podospora pseudopauciseta]|uniref:Annexin n=2 Tax=Podospora TaxID=5144 RepID=A0ABR0I165_9PEZI|nr:hypothetical protein QC763_117530 [Podospora pseudopauciseta]KAK4682599.1 hypothetical protein QC764_117530 [Podospora pseudoanserina]